MKRTPETTESILIECDLPDAPEKVWRALTEPECLGKWIMPCDSRSCRRKTVAISGTVAMLRRAA